MIREKSNLYCKSKYLNKTSGCNNLLIGHKVFINGLCIYYRLKDAIDSIMPSLLDNYEIEHQKFLQKK